MITCICGYYPGSYPEFSIYPGNIGSYPPNVDITIPNEDQRCPWFIHIKSNYDIFIHVMKGYEFIWPMRTKGGTLSCLVGH